MRGIDGRNVLEWRLDPTSPDSIEEARQPGFTPIVVSAECLLHPTLSLMTSTLSILEFIPTNPWKLITRCATKDTHHR